MLEGQKKLGYASVVLAANKCIINLVFLVLLVLTWRVANEALFSA